MIKCLEGMLVGTTLCLLSSLLQEFRGFGPCDFGRKMMSTLSRHDLHL